MAKLNFASKEKRQYCASLGINENDLQFIAPPSAHLFALNVIPKRGKGKGQSGIPYHVFSCFSFRLLFFFVACRLIGCATQSKGPKTFSITVMRSGTEQRVQQRRRGVQINEQRLSRNPRDRNPENNMWANSSLGRRYLVTGRKLIGRHLSKYHCKDGKLNK